VGWVCFIPVLRPVSSRSVTSVTVLLVVEEAARRPAKDERVAPDCTCVWASQATRCFAADVERHDNQANWKAFVSPAAASRARAHFDARLCPPCLNALLAMPATAVGADIVTPPAVPRALSDSHALCTACLGLHAVNDTHERDCPLLGAGLRLIALGWTSGLSEAIRLDLRTRNPRSLDLVVRVLTDVIREALPLEVSNLAAAPHPETPTARLTPAVLVPVPTSGPVDGTARLTERLGQALGLPVISAVTRHKRLSTRGSVASARRRIAQCEYRASDAVGEVAGRIVLLVDDMVTTGHTLTGIAKLLTAAGAVAVKPVVLDRVVSVRTLQRADNRAPDTCQHRTVGFHESSNI
jgi:predicted amidophosphoribosyltransferase